MTDTGQGLAGPSALGIDLEEPTSRSTAVEVGARVALARKAARLTGDQLGQALGLRKDQISKIESGVRRLDIAELARAASALGTSVKTLMGIPERPHLALAHRLAVGAAPESAQLVRRRARQLLEIDDLLTRATDLPPSSPSAVGAAVKIMAHELSSQSVGSARVAIRQGRDLADYARRQLNLGSAGLVDLATICEQHFGVDVALAPWGLEIDGMCVHSGEVALLMASTDFSTGHLRFTLAHELGHHLFLDPREVIDERAAEMFTDELVEKRANTFAAHFLMPAVSLEEVLRWLGAAKNAISDRVLVQVMDYFVVSPDALSFQLFNIGWISLIESKRIATLNTDHVITESVNSAPSGTAFQVLRARRAPVRLVRHAIAAARAQELGLSVIAALLECADDDALWADVMKGSVGAVSGHHQEADNLVL